ncbi:MAG: MFS transporter [bacterium]|jgi:ACDE family multidrug resistance protein
MSISFWGLLSVPFTLVLSNSLLIPVLPQMQKALDISLFQSGLIITAFSLTAGVVIPIAGYISDHVGRKSVMIPALVIFGLGGVAAGLASWLLPNPYPWILVARVTQGIGGGGTYQLAMALAGDIYTGKKRSRAVGYLEAANGFGKVVAPLLGSATALIIWYAPFFVYGLLAWPAAILVWTVCQEPPLATPPKSSEYLAELKKVWAKRGIGLAACFIAGFLALFLLFGLLSYLADVLEQQLHVKGFTRGLLVAIPVLSLTVTCSLVGVYLEKRLGTPVKKALLLGLALVTIALIALALLPPGYIYFAPLVIAAIGTGIFLPALNLLITSACSGERGFVTALYGTVRFFGAALGPPAVGLGLEMGKTPLFFVFAAAAAIVLALVWWLVNPYEMLPEKLVKSSRNKGEKTNK